MRIIILLGLLLQSYSTFADELQVVDHVDIAKYLGTWHEIAAIPQKFQKQCVANTQAEYSLTQDGGDLAVLNSCETSDGTRDRAEGRAKIEDRTTNAKLKVTFVNILGWRYAFGGDYWIIDLDPNYQFAVVGHPKRTYGWILSRTAQLAPETIQLIAIKLTQNGYNTCAFKVTKQTGGLDGQKRLCDIAIPQQPILIQRDAPKEN